MQRLFRRSTPIILSGLLALFGAAACGDDDGGDGGATDQGDDGDDGGDDADDGDDGGDDADDGEPDASVPEVVRQGTVAITETSVTNAGGQVSGGVVSISYVDLESITVPPVKGFENGIGFCAVTVYDVTAGDAEPTLVDEGPISVTGTTNGDIACAFAAGEYRCQSLDADSAGGSAANAEIDNGTPTSTVFVQGSDLDTAAVIGSQLVLTGFGNKAIDNLLLPVVARPAASTFAIAAELPDAVGPKGATYATFIGAGPIPNAGGVYNFINDKSEVVVSAEASESGLVPEFSGTYTPEGEGFELVDDPTTRNFLPHQIPTVNPPAGDVIFACAKAGCGTTGAGGNTDAIIINGRTTDGALPPADLDPLGTAMPDPVGSYATFQCAFPTLDAATILSAELAEILDTNPTRIQTTVLKAQATLNATSASQTAETRILIGHSQTGFTTVEPKAPPTVARPTK